MSRQLKKILKNLENVELAFASLIFQSNNPHFNPIRCIKATQHFVSLPFPPHRKSL
jgi:hypothetical protein